MARFIPRGLGWLRDLPDPRDCVATDAPVRAALARLKRRRGRRAQPARVDWREFFGPVDDQGGLRADTAHACAAMVGYFERRAHGKKLEGSIRFVYKMTRQLMGLDGDTGAGLRTTFKAIAQFGIPPTRFCPYEEARFDEEPAAFLFSYAPAFRSITYVRLDPPLVDGPDVLAAIKQYLAAGFVTTLGFTVFDSLGADADILPPTVFDSVRGGQAVVVVGYDDARRIRSARGALLVRNSWGTAWGEAGYGWLPFDYVDRGLAVDCWTLLRPDWLASEEFTRPFS